MYAVLLLFADPAYAKHFVCNFVVCKGAIRINSLHYQAWNFILLGARPFGLGSVFRASRP